MKKRLNSQEQELIEYALILIMVAVVLLAMLALFNPIINNIFTAIKSQFGL